MLILILSVGVKQTEKLRRKFFAIKKINIRNGFSRDAKKLTLCGIFAFVAVFAFLGFSFIASALVDPVRSVDITSQNTSYENNEAGAWKITKSAKWIARGKARITLEANSIEKGDDRPKDILLVLDNSGSMLGQRLDIAKLEISNLVNTLMTERDARFGLITFNSTASLVHDFTDNRQAILDAIDGLGVYGQTNYYQAFLRMEEVFQSYQATNGRRPIVVFLTDGAPTQDSPLEVSEYQVFKSLYPDVSIRAVQYEMGKDILPALAAISDYQWSSDMEIIGETLWRAIAEGSYFYDTFTVTDYINDTYYTIDSASAISATAGTTTLEYEGTTPKITWNMDGAYQTGVKERLTIDVKIRDQYFEDEDGRYPTNTQVKVASTLRDTPNENLTSNLTPILKLKYLVTMDNNIPRPTCTERITSEKHIVFDPVDMEYATGEWCGDYYTHGWDLVDEEIERIGTDYFIMPEEDVDLKALWRKTTIDKSMDGEIYDTPTAYLREGIDMNVRMKNLVPGASATWQGNEDHTITSVKRALTKPEDFETITKTTLSKDDSPFPVYAWLGSDGETVFYWSDAEKIYMNPNSYCMFENFFSLEEVPGLSDFIASTATDISWFFKNNNNLTDLSGIAGWDVTNVVNMIETFIDCNELTNIDDLTAWRLPKVKNIARIFKWSDKFASLSGAKDWGMASLEDASEMCYGCPMLTTLNGLQNWDVRNLKYFNNSLREAWEMVDISALSGWHTDSLLRIDGAFRENRKLEDISALTNWDVSHVYDFGYTFNECQKLVDITPLAGWNTESATIMFHLFHRAWELVDLTPLAGWDLSNVEDGNEMFAECHKIQSLEPLRGWDVSKIKSLNGMFYENWALTSIEPLSGWHPNSNTSLINTFYDCYNLLSLNGIQNWNVSAVTTMNSAFEGCKKIETLSYLSNWNVSNVEDMTDLFTGANALADISALANWSNKVQNVKAINNFLANAKLVTSLEPFRNWDFDNLTNLWGAFRGIPNITSAEPIKNWDVTKVTDFGCLFQGDWYLSDLTGLSNWSLDSAQFTRYMFEETSVSDLSELAGWDMSGVEDMGSMFAGDELITSVEPLRNWDVSNCTAFYTMFRDDTGITSFEPIENWAVQSQSNMEQMFKNIDASVQRPSWYQE